MEDDKIMTLNFCEKCRRGYGFKDLKRNLNGELLCLECFALSGNQDANVSNNESQEKPRSNLKSGELGNCDVSSIPDANVSQDALLGDKE